MHINYLKVDTIYHLRKGTEGLKIAFIESNRNVARNNKAMKDDCIALEQQTPGILTRASLAMEAGYKLIDVVDGHTVSEAEAENYLVLVDGHTRFHGYKLSWDQDQNAEFDYLFQFREYSSPERFQAVYRAINTRNNRTKGEDFTRDLLATSDNPVLKSVRDKTEAEICSKAAWIVTLGKEYHKSYIEQLQKGKIPEAFQDETNLKRFDNVYEAVKDGLLANNNKVFKGSEVWKFVADKINNADDKAKMSSRLVEMFNKLSAKNLGKLQAVKAGKTKENEVWGILETALQDIH